MPNTTTGFLPIRSAAIPQIVEVKHRPNINEAPIRQVNKESVKVRARVNLKFEQAIHEKFTHKAGIEPNIFCPFCNMQVSYLCNKTRLEDLIARVEIVVKKGDKLPTRKKNLVLVIKRRHENRHTMKYKKGNNDDIGKAEKDRDRIRNLEYALKIYVKKRIDGICGYDKYI